MKDYPPLEPARIDFAAGVPWSRDYGDRYHSADGGLGQARHVFLAGNGLPERWRGRAAFDVLETGFGLGFNFLATWNAWARDPAAPHRLHYRAVDKHPPEVADLERAHRLCPELEPLAASLRAAWPMLVAGFHRREFSGGQVILTLMFGEVRDVLAECDAQADAIYLDGFAPAANPAMWTPEVCRQLARLSAPAATLATYSAASQVARALSDAGFVIRKAPGFGRKREMLLGARPGAAHAVAKSGDKRAIVVGAGLAGSCCAERLAARGYAVRVLERRDGPAHEASGNPAGVLRPILSAGETVATRLSRAAFGYALRYLPAEARLSAGLLHLAVKPGEGDRLTALLEGARFPGDFVRSVTVAEAEALAGCRVGAPGCWFPHGAAIAPVTLCAAKLRGVPAEYGIDVARIEAGDGVWRVSGAEAPLVILANAADCSRLLSQPRLPLAVARGQLTYLPERPGVSLCAAVTGDGFVASMAGGYCAGATFQRGDLDPCVRETDARANLARLETLLPGFAAGLDPARLGGRVAWRATTPDRLPIFGEVAPGLFVATGLGARGLLWAPLGAELIASLASGEPLPVERSLAQALSPLRFFARRERLRDTVSRT